MEKFHDSWGYILLKQWLREGRERNSCLCCGLVVIVEREGVQLLVSQKWLFVVS